jgi:MFS family permease
VHILSFFYKVDFISFLVFAIILLGINGLFSAASMPMLVSVLPKEKYGQFCSANGMARGLGTMIGGVGVGVFLKYMDSHTPGENTHYRWIFIWVGLLHVASLVSLFLLNREWQRLGGKVGYKAPAPWREAT